MDGSELGSDGIVESFLPSYIYPPWMCVLVDESRGN